MQYIHYVLILYLIYSGFIVIYSHIRRNNMTFTFKQKKICFKKGLYKCPVPPVELSRFWSEYDWFRHVDRHGVWCH